MKKKLFKFGLFNAGSLCNVRKHSEFIAAVERHQPDVIAINETWLRAGGAGRAPAVSGYRLRHVPRTLGTRKAGGGVGFYIKSSLSAQICDHVSYPDIEQMWFKTKINSVCFLVGTAYRPPWLDTDLFLDAISDSLASFSKYDKIILAGDFNINLFNVNSGKTNRLTQFLSMHKIQNHVKGATHFTVNCSTLIDLICTDASVHNTEIDHVEELGAHALVFAELSVKCLKQKPKTTTNRSLGKIDKVKFNKDVHLINWEIIHLLANIEDKVALFNANILQLFDAHAPIRKHIIRESSKPWITPNVRYMMVLRNDAQRKYKCTKSDSDKENYKSMKNLVSTSLYFEQKAYFNQNINNNLNRPKLLWKNLKNNILPNFKNEADIPKQFNDPTAMNITF
jgi:exonuclease III